VRMLAEHNLGIDPMSFVKLYHEKFPAAKRLINACSHEAETRGEIRTILNRRNTFNLWEPIDDDKPAIAYEKALTWYGPRIQRAGTYKALNRRLQGSAADIMKKAMVDAYEAGIYEKTGFPYITVHDELDFGYHPDLHADFVQLKEIMENPIQLKVPLRVDFNIGPDWGHLEDFEL
jgi:DNA polymerase I